MINYYLLTKPKIVFGNLLTVFSAFYLGSKSNLDYVTFFSVLFGISLVMASSCVFNNMINKEIDKKMERTKNRALVKGLISQKQALFFGLFLGFLGFLTLYFLTNLITTLIALFGYFIYVGIYSYWKSETIYGTAIGSIAGAVPPVVGYTAASHELDLAASLLFIILILWQMPHFFSIAINHLEDYKNANIPTLPTERSMKQTKVHTIIYTFLFLVFSTSLYFLGYMGPLFLVTTFMTGLSWFFLSFQGFFQNDDQLWSQRMFKTSLIVISNLSIIIPLDLYFFRPIFER